MEREVLTVMGEKNERLDYWAVLVAESLAGQEQQRCVDINK